MIKTITSDSVWHCSWLCTVKSLHLVVLYLAIEAERGKIVATDGTHNPIPSET